MTSALPRREYACKQKVAKLAYWETRLLLDILPCFWPTANTLSPTTRAIVANDREICVTHTPLLQVILEGCTDKASRKHVVSNVQRRLVGDTERRKYK